MGTLNLGSCDGQRSQMGTYKFARRFQYGCNKIKCIFSVAGSKMG